MKKIFSMFLAVALSGIAFTACNDDPAEPLEYNTYQTAIVKGKVLVNADRTVTPQKWSAPTGITVIAEVDNSDITGQSASGTYRTNAAYNATTGEYTVSVPVNYSGSYVAIIVKEWTGTVKETDAVHAVLWRKQDTSVFVKPGDVSSNNNILFNSGYEKLNVAVGEPTTNN